MSGFHDGGNVLSGIMGASGEALLSKPAAAEMERLGDVRGSGMRGVAQPT